MLLIESGIMVKISLLSSCRPMPGCSFFTSSIVSPALLHHKQGWLQSALYLLYQKRIPNVS